MFIRRFLEGTAHFRAPEGEGGATDPAETEATSEESGAQEEGAAAAAASSAEPQQDWRERQINRQHRMIKDKDRELADMRAENERLKALAERAAGGTQSQQTEQPAAPAMTREQIQAEAERLANARFDQDTYNRDCNDTFNKGKATYGDKWEPTLKVLSQFSEIANDTAVMKEILRTDDPAKVLFELGSNPAEAQRLLELSPTRRQTELIKIAIKEKPVTTTKPTNVGDPVDPINGRGGSAKADDIYNDKMSDEEFYAIRAKQKKERFATRGGR